MRAILIALAGMFLVSGAARAEPVDLTEVLENSGIERVRVTVNDPVYEREQRYEGYPLSAVLERFFPDIQAMREEGSELVFTAADGYSPSMSLEKALASRGVIAVRDLNRPADDPWEQIRQGRQMVSPAPYYLVWENVDPEDPAYKWPYQLVRLDIVPFTEQFENAVPQAGGARAERGFVLFRENCMACHAVNLIGGDLGPELNVPRNVTEYWRADLLPAFIANASDFRARSKMPAFPHLSREQIGDILFYLQQMAGQKICGGGGQEACPD